MKMHFLITIYLLLISSCTLLRAEKYYRITKSAKKSYSIDGDGKVMFDGALEPKWPNYIINNLSVLGEDDNSNGIRDDIEIWINRISNSEYMRLALKQVAKAEQANLFALDRKDNEGILKTNYQRMDAYACLSFIETLFDKNEKKQFEFLKDDLYWLSFYSTGARQDALISLRYISYSGEPGSGGMCEAWKYCKFAFSDLTTFKKKCRTNLFDEKQ